MIFNSGDITLCISCVGNSYNSVKKILEQATHQRVRAVVVVQFYHMYQSDWNELKLTFRNVLIIYDDGKGLSRSRNIALKNVNDGICYICDDDVILTPEFSRIVCDAHTQNQEEYLLFKVRDIEGRDYKNYPPVTVNLGINDLLKVSSIEISFKKNPGCCVLFDERFGLGTEQPTGEEYIFLIDNFKLRKEFRFIPHHTMIHPLESSSKRLSEKLLIAKVSVIKRARGSLYGLTYCLYLAILKRKYISSFSSGYFRSLYLMAKTIIKNGK